MQHQLELTAGLMLNSTEQTLDQHRDRWPPGCCYQLPRAPLDELWHRKSVPGVQPVPALAPTDSMMHKFI